jgi:CRP-like cAMP-binding protein
MPPATLASGDMPGQVIEVFRQPFSVAPSERRVIPSAEAEAFNLLIDRMGVRMSYAPKERIFHENDPAENVYKVVSGLVCTTKFLSDGRRHIGGFYMPGDYFGLECSRAHTLSAEVVTNAKVRMRFGSDSQPRCYRASAPMADDP